ncbi:MAG: GAF domain-containing protein [Deferrisomatales bacterium]
MTTPPLPLPGTVLPDLVRISSLATSLASRDEVLTEVLGAVVHDLGFERAALYLVPPGRGSLEPVLGRDRDGGFDPPPVPPEHTRPPELLALRTGQLTALGDPGQEWSPEAEGCAGLVVPLWARDGVIGVLRAEGPPEGGRHLAPQVPFLRLLANQATAAVENRALQQSNQAKIEQLLALQRVSRQMTSTLGIDRLLGMVVEEALNLTAAEGGLLYLREGGSDRLRVEAWAGVPPPPGRETLAVGYGIPGWVAHSGKPLRVSDRGTHRPGAGYSSRKSQLAVPLLSEGRVLGVLALEATREEPFSATHEELLSIFAAQAAKAIEAARFFEQTRQERDLRDRILAGSPNGVVALDAARRIVLMNQAAQALLGVPEDPRGDPIERYLSSPAFLAGLGRVLANASPLETTELRVGSGEGLRHVVVKAFALGDSAHRGATLILEDLTERRRLDEQVQRMARLASIGQLAAGIAHEIRNPLTGVAISLDILREETLSPPGRELLDDINREIDRLEQLIRGLLDFARPQPVERRRMRIAKALEWHRTFREQCRKRGVRFRLDLRRNPKLEGDPEKLKQLFLNLAINALEATPDGGEVHLWADALRAGGSRWVRVVVKDTGAGMSAETRDQIFNPFFTTKNEGTGLGLSIVHSIAHQHGGRVDVESAPGKGTRFIVDLPALELPEE